MSEKIRNQLYSNIQPYQHRLTTTLPTPPNNPVNTPHTFIENEK